MAENLKLVNGMSEAFYRLIQFTDRKTWGAPLPHLVGMRFHCSKQPSDSEKCEIDLFFSVETVRISGRLLGPIWEQLVRGKVTHIKMGRIEDPGGKTISIVDSIGPREESKSAETGKDEKQNS